MRCARLCGARPSVATKTGIRRHSSAQRVAHSVSYMRTINDQFTYTNLRLSNDIGRLCYVDVYQSEDRTVWVSRCVASQMDTRRGSKYNSSCRIMTGTSSVDLVDTPVVHLRLLFV